MSAATITPHDDDRPLALVRAEESTDAWSDVARYQRWATPDHADFYALAGELTSTLHTFEDLTGVLVGQVAGYATGRHVYDDARTVDPAVRLADAVAQLRQARTGLRTAATAINEFWSAIGHVGIEAQP
jgi:hypothetical protein